MAGKFQLKRSANSQFYFVLKAGGNHETIGTSETYTSKQSAINGIHSVQTNAPYDSRYTRFQGSNNQYYFNLRAAGNSQIILQSEGYVSAQGRDNGIESVKINAPTADLEDLT